MTLEDTRLRRRLMREIGKRYIDATRLTVDVTHGVCDIKGEIRPLRGMRVALEEEIETIEMLLKRVPGVRDIKMDVRIPIAHRTRK